ncbi:MAG: adenylosuccinate lyase [Candidatus Nezhaarchaeales archaeon]
MSDNVCVFDWRYGSREVKNLFTVENIVKTYIKVEVALLKALGSIGLAPSHCFSEIEKCANNIDPMDIYRKEAIIGHDIASLAFILGEKCGECGKYVHLGATSYDIVDTTWALILRDAINILKRKLGGIIEKLLELAKEHAHTYVIGRTHGQHALPVTFGFKFANYAYELARSYERLVELEKRLIRLKMSGSVGTMASWRDRGFLIEDIIGKELGLEPHPITTQVAPRDGFAEFISVLAILASQLDRLALEIRELSRTEISEVYEAVERVGSSAMPHKKNPVIAERISGLAKIARSLVLVALENIVLMHERDLTNSSSERILIPHAVLTLDQMLEDTSKMLSVIKIDKEKARINIDLTKGAVYSELLVTKLVEKGWARHEAYMKIKEISETIRFKEDLVKAVLQDPKLSKYFSENELLSILNPEYATENVERIIERTLKYVQKIVSTEYKKSN